MSWCRRAIDKRGRLLYLFTSYRLSVVTTATLILSFAVRFTSIEHFLIRAFTHQLIPFIKINVALYHQYVCLGTVNMSFPRSLPAIDLSKAGLPVEDGEDDNGLCHSRMSLAGIHLGRVCSAHRFPYCLAPCNFLSYRIKIFAFWHYK